MQVWCDWQVTLYDPHLSALEVRFSRRCAIQIDVYLTLPLPFNDDDDDDSDDGITLLIMWLMQSNRPAFGDKWEERVSRRLQRIADALNKELNNGLEYGRLHRTLASLENEMLSRKDAGITPFFSTVEALPYQIKLIGWVDGWIGD